MDHMKNLSTCRVMKNVILKQTCPSIDPMIIYLCSPNNPTGIALDKGTNCLGEVRKQTGSVIFDAAYEAFITENVSP